MAIPRRSLGPGQWVLYVERLDHILARMTTPNRVAVARLGPEVVLAGEITVQYRVAATLLAIERLVDDSDRRNSPA